MVRVLFFASQGLFFVSAVCPAGIEPATYRLEGGCSIRLSYGHVWGISMAA
jgi:hypothetical protein